MSNIQKTRLFAFFFPHLTGHNLEYLNHLDRVLDHQDASVKHVVVTQLCNKPIIQALRFSPSLDIRYIGADGGRQLGGQTRDRLSAMKATIANIAILKQLHAACEDLGVTTCVIMHLNIFQLALAFVRLEGVTYRGILFFPYARLELDGVTGLRARAGLWLKRIAMNFMCLFSSIERIFILNDPETVNRLNNRHSKKKYSFRILLDPISDFEPPKSNEYLKEKNRITMSLLGSIDERKGVYSLLNAIKYLSFEERSHLRLIIVGRFNVADKQELEALLKNTQTDLSEVEYIIEDRFLSNQEFSSLVLASDILLLPYQRTEGSSGMLGHAALNKRPVIGPETGLVGALIRQYRLGLSVDVTSPAQLAQAIVLALQNSPLIEMDAQLSSQYIKERQPEKFVRSLIEC